jgi:LCP family protein required for cell wall assembly
MSKGKKIFSWIFFLVLAFILVGSLALRILNTPLGPRLEVTEPPATTTPSESAGSSQQSATPIPVVLDSTCGGQGSFAVLVLGESSPEDYPPRGADAVRLVYVDYDTKTVKIMAFPPDLWVNTSQIPVLKSNNSTLTYTYYISKSSLSSDERSKMAYATNATAQTIVNNFRYIPENYMTLKQFTFKDLVDDLGGLSIILPEAVDGTSSGFGYYNAGAQVMTGQQALDYVRIIESNQPKTQSEWGRFDRQNQVLVALLFEMTQPENLTKLPEIIKEYYQAVVTDLTLNQLLDLTCVLSQPGISYQYVEFEQSLIVSEKAGILVPDSDGVTQFLQTSFPP